MRAQRRGILIVIATVVAIGAVAAVGLIRDHGAKPVARTAPGCAATPITPGIDVSYHQGEIAWPRVHKAGIRFAFIRVADGATVVDERFRFNWQAARAARIARGAYQYFRPGESAIAQADLVVDALARDRGELPPVLDVEVTGGKTPAQLATAIRTWLDRVRGRLGVEPIIYASPDFWRDRVGGVDVSRQPLWVAHYTSGCPRVPAPWTTWTFWQHSKTGRVPGIVGDVDLDVFSGDQLPRP